MLYFFNLCCTYSITIDNIYTLAKGTCGEDLKCRFYTPQVPVTTKNIQGLPVAKGTCGAEHVNYDFVKATTLTD
jgi:hypothetical protein